MGISSLEKNARIMDTYSQKQLKLTEEIEEKFKRGENPSTIVQPVKDYTNDKRICLTGVVFIPKNLEQKILDEFIKPLQEADSSQYFYVPGSFHVTIQNVRTINNPPLFTKDDIQKASKVFEAIVLKHKIFSLKLERLFELPTSLALCAFSDESLRDIAHELRDELSRAGIPDNKSYASADVVLGNVTIVRYTRKPNDEFKNKIKELKETKVDSFDVREVSLITTNSVCIPNKTRIIKKYNLV